VSGHSRRVAVGLVAAGLALSALPALGVPAFYESFLFLVFFWVSLATSWSFLSGYAGYFSFGHGAFFGAGVYTTATLTAGFGAEVSAVVAEEAFLSLDAPIQRLAIPDVPTPYNVSLMHAILPQVDQIAGRIAELIEF